MQEPVLVRNLEKGPSVFMDPQTRQQFTWQGHGDHAGEDFQYVSPEIVQMPAFMRSVNRGIFEIVKADAETQAALDRQTESWHARQSAIAEASKSSIDPGGEREVAHVTIGDKGQITGVPLVTGVRTSADQEGGASETETTIPVIIEPSQHAQRATT